MCKGLFNIVSLKFSTCLSEESLVTGHRGQVSRTTHLPVLCLRNPSHINACLKSTLESLCASAFVLRDSIEMIAAINHSPTITIKPKHTYTHTQAYIHTVLYYESHFLICYYTKLLCYSIPT